MVYLCLSDDVCHHLTSNIAAQGLNDTEDELRVILMGFMFCYLHASLK